MAEFIQLKENSSKEMEVVHGSLPDKNPHTPKPPKTLKIKANRKEASKSQVATLVTLSEQKNTAKAHYHIMTIAHEISSSDASYEIQRLSSKDMKVLPKWDYLTNRKITEDPNHFIDKIKDKEIQATEAGYAWRLRNFQEAINEKDWPRAAICYIELKNSKEFQEDTELYEETKRKLEIYISKIQVPAAFKHND